MQRRLHVEHRSALPASLRFFASAPVFALLAALLLLVEGAPALSSHWSSAMLACTHLMVLGALSMTMAGALMQIIPVLFGVELAMVGVSAAAIHVLLAGGALLLAGAFYLRPLFGAALAPLLLAVAWLLALLGASLVRCRSLPSRDLLRGLWLALASLLPTAVIGGAMAAALFWQIPLPLARLTGWHATWGLGGWIGLLVIAVSLQVIPMFQVTPPYPPHLSRWLMPAIAVALLLWPALAAACFALYAVATLLLLARRKRPGPDATTWYWRIALVSLLSACLVWLGGVAPVATGILFIYGFGWSAVQGMLLKILPFLLWQHWQEQGFDKPVPGIRLVLPEQAAMIQLRWHACALLLLLGACRWPELTRAAALAACLAPLQMGWNMWRAVRLQPAY